MTDSVTVTGDFAIAAGAGRAYFAFANNNREIVVSSTALSPLPVSRNRIVR
jgi:hypothetical protein